MAYIVTVTLDKVDDKGHVRIEARRFIYKEYEQAELARDEATETLVTRELEFKQKGEASWPSTDIDKR